MNHNLLYSHNCYFCYQNRLEMTHLYNVGLEHRQKLPGRIRLSIFIWSYI